MLVVFAGTTGQGWSRSLAGDGAGPLKNVVPVCGEKNA